MRDMLLIDGEDLVLCAFVDDKFMFSQDELQGYLMQTYAVSADEAIQFMRSLPRTMYNLFSTTARYHWGGISSEDYFANVQQGKNLGQHAWRDFHFLEKNELQQSKGINNA